MDQQVEQANDDFNAGFSGTPTAPTETPEIQQEVDQQQAQPEPEQTQEQVQEQVQEPKYRQITEEEFNKLSSSAAAVEEMRATFGKQVDTAFGKIGGIERFMQQLQQGTQAGVEISAEDVADLASEYGDELSGAMLKTLQKVASKFKGTGQSIDKSEFEQLAEAKARAIVESQVDVNEELAELSRRHPTWADDRNTPEFAEWAETLTPYERKKFTNSKDADYVSGKLSAFYKYRDEKTVASTQADTAAQSRRDRFEQAITPPGDGAAMPETDLDDAFNAGFQGR